MAAPNTSERDPLLAVSPVVDAERALPAPKSSAKFNASAKTAIALLTAVSVVLGGGLLLALTGHDVLGRDGRVDPHAGIHAPPASTSPPAARKRNVIMMVSDGFGPASETFGRTMFHELGRGGDKDSNRDGAPADWWGPTTPLDEILVGTSRTRSSSSWVTDSAAGATAFSCARKSYNGAIGVTADQQPCATVFEAAKLAGYKTGLVVTSRITHATPASFNSHVLWRDYENDIAEQQLGDLPLIGRSADLMLGGGRRHFVPLGHPESIREDERDLLAEAKQQGLTVLTTRADFDALTSSTQLPALGVFTPDHMSYELDRDPAKEPALVDMAVRGLELLRNATDADPTSPGFFLMIEGSRIDMAAHSNDPGTHAHEILMYYRTIAAVRAFVDRHPDTVMVSTSDHETGGLALARQVSAKYPEYLWKPDVVARQRKSTVALAAAINSELASPAGPKSPEKLVADLVARDLGVTDLTPDELAYLCDPARLGTEREYALATAISVRAQLGWSTHGHSGVDVNLYAYGRGSEALRGNHENTDVGLFLQSHLGLSANVASLSTALQREIKFKHPGLPPEHDGPGLMGVESDEHARAAMAGHY
ncbi:vacuolar alkaline phosphatase [Blastocladiella emersonii ATCC 22665]|nr:vacuolar alkaline phosphatase [Blastocladiella emersonii ATCC 22665]